MTASGTLTWFARHELTLAWRDWAAMMAGGRTTRERAVTAGTLIFIALLHLLAYYLVEPVISEGIVESKATLVMLTGMILLTFSMMMSQAIEQVTRSFYARADLDLILSSPAPAQHLFAIRIASIALAGTALTSLLAAPFINTAAVLDGPRWLSAYAVIATMSALATGVSVMASVALFRTVGAKRTRLIAQIVAAVVGATLLIGIQVAAILFYGNLSRFAVLRSDTLVNAAPGEDSLFWTPARALLGDGTSVMVLAIASLAFLAAVIATYASRLSAQAIATAGIAEDHHQAAASVRTFRTRSTAQALRRKEWILLRRDPWLASQTLMQILYLLPPALLLWRDMGADTKVHVILAPVLVMAFGQLAGGLAWLAISGEDAPDLVATAPLAKRALIRAKNEAVLAVITVAVAPMLLALSLVSLLGAAATALGVIAASMSAITIQMWFKVPATRSQFRRRQTASRVSTFAEAFSSIFWAGAAGFAATGSWFTPIFVALAVLTLWAAWLVSPRTE